MSYIKREWKTGDVITAEKLNHIEEGITQQSPIILYPYYDEEFDGYTKVYLDAEYTELFMDLDTNGDLYFTYEEAKAAYDKWLGVLDGIKFGELDGTGINSWNISKIYKANIDGVGIRLGIEDIWNNFYSCISFIDNSKTCITFSSDEPFTLKYINVSGPTWDGTIEYSTDLSNWYNWDGSEIESEADNKIYLRGRDNSVITGGEGSWHPRFGLTGSNISCSGNIENLLDWQTVSAGGHPSMSRNCFSALFAAWDSDSIITAPELPATTLTEGCYEYMFDNCTSLATVPELPATTLGRSCYSGMFMGCTSLTTAPELPATTLMYSCYQSMFEGCTSLTTPPELPATTLADSCYRSMFFGCALIKLSETQDSDYTTPYRIPKVGTGIDVSYALDNMFADTGGTFTGTPTINTTYYLNVSNNESQGEDIK